MSAFSEKTTEKPSLAGYGVRKVLAVISGLWAFFFIQPLFDLLAKNPQFIGVHDIGGAGLVGLVVLLLLPVPLVLSLIVALVSRIHGKTGQTLLLVVTWLMVAAGLRPFLGQIIGFPGWVQFFLAGGLALGLCILTARKTPVIRKLHLLGFLPFVLGSIFLLQPGPRSYIRPPRVETAHPGKQTVTQPEDQTPVVLVVFDAFPTVSMVDREMNIDPTLCPNLSRFAQDAIWYRNALAVSPATIWAVPAIMTGKIPSSKSSPTIEFHRDNIFTWLAGTHDIFAFESHTHLDPTDARRLPFRDNLELTLSDLSIILLHVMLPEDLASGVPVVTNDWIGFAQGKSAGHSAIPDREQLAQEFLSSLADSPRPGCYFLHALVPHGPTQLLPSGNRYTKEYAPPGGEGNQWGLWSDDLWTVINGHQRHLLQVGYADWLAGQIIDRLKTAGLYEKSLVVFCADHGMGFMPGDARRALSETNKGDILPVPLFIKFPGNDRVGVDDRPMATIDILQTMAGALGTSLDWSEGRDFTNDQTVGRKILDFMTSKGRNQTTVDSILDQMQISLEIKYRRFGPNPLQDGLFAPLRGSTLLGQSVPGDLPLYSGIDIATKKENPWRSPDPATGLVPVEVNGFMASSDTLASHLDLAVAVDGIIRAVFRPFGRKPGSDMEFFSAMVPENSMGPGEHFLSFLVVDWSGSNPRLFATNKGKVPVLDQNLLVTPLPDMKTSGFYELAYWDGVPTRWTDGAAKIFLPIPGGDFPEGVQMKLARVARPDASVYLLVNGTPVIAEHLGPETWIGARTLTSVDFQEEIRIGLFSGSFVPAETQPGSRDTRKLGVPLQLMKLTADPVQAEPKARVIPSVTIRPGSDHSARMTGFFTTENWQGEPAAWTGGQSDLEISWNQEGFPEHLYLSLAGTGPDGTHLSISVNGQPVFDRKVPADPQLELIDLENVPQASPIHIRMTCDTFCPGDENPGSGDDRQLGVAFRLLTLF